jgi:hypothetical protein
MIEWQMADELRRGSADVEHGEIQRASCRAGIAGRTRGILMSTSHPSLGSPDR